MDVTMVVAGGITVAVGLGHSLVGVRWVLPTLPERRLSGTALGPPSMTLAMLRVTWFVVTVFALAAGGVLLSFALDVNPRVAVLRWFAGMWLAATALSLATIRPNRRGLRNFMRLPVPLLWVVIAALCLTASH